MKNTEITTASEGSLGRRVSREVAAHDGPFQIQCAGCFTARGGVGNMEGAISLMEGQGWVFGAQVLCPKCTKDRARKFMRRYSDDG